MPIVNRDLRAGTRLVATYKRQEYRAEVVTGEDGKPRYRLEDGQEFKSLSAAGRDIMAGRACNGWSFWSLAREEAGLAATPEQTAEPKGDAEPAAKPKGKKKGKAELEVDCRCLSYQPGSEGCKLEESGDCRAV